jgi:hypothetical protein
MTEIELIEMYCEVDDFSKEFEKKTSTSLLAGPRKRRHRPNKMSPSEVMTVLISFHRSGYRTFKDFYLKYVWTLWNRWFPDLLSYTRFLALIPRTLMPLTVFLQTRFGQDTGIAFIDSTKIEVCKTKRITRNKVFEGLAKIGKSSMGWFYGFKCHIIINDIGELLAVKLTPGNVDDRKPVPELAAGLTGKLFGDKGYISKKLFNELWDNGCQLITSIRDKMKNKLMPIIDKILLRKRSIIETVNDQLKNISQIEHSRHRSPTNAFVNITAALIAYTFQPKKPKLKFDVNLDDELKILTP